MVIAVGTPPGRAEDGHLVGVHRLERIVLRLQAHAPFLAKEPLHRRVLVADEGDDDLAVPGVDRLRTTT